MERRDFIKYSMKMAASLATIPAALGAGTAYALGMPEDLANYDLILPRVRFNNDTRMHDKWNVLPVSERYLLEEFSQHVRCKVKMPPLTTKRQTFGKIEDFSAVVSFENFDEIKHYPMALMTSDGFFQFSPTELKNLKRYIEHGGFVIMDDCVSNKQGEGDFFYQSCYKALTQIFGPNSVQLIPNSHEMFHNVFDVSEKGFPFIQGQNHGARGIIVDGSVRVLLSATDIHCGWADRDHSYYGPNGRGPGRANYQDCIEMGINILMYAMSH